MQTHRGEIAVLLPFEELVRSVRHTLLRLFLHAKFTPAKHIGPAVETLSTSDASDHLRIRQRDDVLGF